MIEPTNWSKIQMALREFQPAKCVKLVGDPPSKIRAEAYGDVVDVDPGLLARIVRVAGTTFRIVAD